MPTQARTDTQVYQYIEFSTGPPLEDYLRHPQTGELLDLTGATVSISIAWSMPHGSYYTSPRDRIVDESPAVVDPDQTTNPGHVSWNPGTEIGVDALTPPGTFLYQWYVTMTDATLWIIPGNTYQPLTIRARVGGRAYNPGGS